MPQGVFIDPQSTFQRSQLVRMLGADRFRQLEFRKNVIDFQTKQFEQDRFSQNLQRAAGGLSAFFKERKQEEALDSITDLFGGVPTSGTPPTFDPDIVGPPSPFPDELVSSAGGPSFEQPQLQQQPSFEQQKFQALIQLMQSKAIPFDAAALLQAAPDTTTAQQKLNRGLATLPDGRQVLDGRVIPPEKQAPLAHEERQANTLAQIEARSNATQARATNKRGLIRDESDVTDQAKIKHLIQLRSSPEATAGLNADELELFDAEIENAARLFVEGVIKGDEFMQLTEGDQEKELEPVINVPLAGGGSLDIVDVGNGERKFIEHKAEKEAKPDPAIEAALKAEEATLKADAKLFDTMFKEAQAETKTVDMTEFSKRRAERIRFENVSKLLAAGMPPGAVKQMSDNEIERTLQAVADGLDIRAIIKESRKSKEAKAGATIAGATGTTDVTPPTLEEAQRVIDQWRSLTPEQRQNMPNLQREIFRAATNVPGVK